MTKTSVFFLIFVALLLLFVGCGKEATEEEVATDVAGEWIRENAPSFMTRNGHGLEHIETTETGDGAYNVKFVFESAFGYGTPKEGNVVTDFKIEKTIVITVENETVIGAITDNRYDEMNDKFSLSIIPTEEEMMIITDRVKRLASAPLSVEEFTKALKKETVRINFLQNTPISVTEEDIVEYMTNIDAFDTKEDFIEYWTTEREVSEEILLQEVFWDVKMGKLAKILIEETDIPEERLRREYESYTDWMEGRVEDPLKYEEFIKDERVEREVVYRDIISWEMGRINEEAENTIKIE